MWTIVGTALADWDARDRRIVAAAGSAALAVFGVDYALPLGYAVPVLYCLIVLSALPSRRPATVWAFALVATLLLIVGFAVKLNSVVPLSAALFNRCVGLTVIWGCALFVDRSRRLQSVIEDERARFAGIIDSAMDAIISVDSEQRIVLFNQAAEVVFRCKASEAIGTPLARFIPERSRAVHAEHIRLFAQTGVSRRRMGHLGKIRGLRADGQMFAAEGAISQVRVGGAKLYTVILRDVSEAKLNEARSARLDAIVNSTSDAIMSLALDGTIQSWNSGSERLFGYSAEEALGQSATMLVPEHYPADEVLARIVKGEAFTYETERRRKDGQLISVIIAVAPIRTANGDVIAANKIVHDLTGRKQREEKIGFLHRELAHRSKNLLSVVQAIAGQTARHSVSLEDFQSRFVERVQGLARSQDVLVRGDWKEISLEDLVRTQLSTFAEVEGGPIELKGPRILLSADAAQSIGMALHELATNASKYGALSVPTGRVTLSWELAGELGEPRSLRLTWAERDGPPVAAPQRTGFGHVVLERMVGASLNGSTSVEFAPAGITWSLEIPASHVKEVGEV